MNKGRRYPADRRRAGRGGQATAVPAVAPVARRAGTRGQLLEDERVLGWMLLAPTIVLLGLFIAYPFVKGVWLSLTSATVGRSRATSSGFKNFVKIWNDSIFQRAAYNTFVYTGIATVGKLALGMWLALLLNRHFKGKRLVRASMLLPFIVPDRAVDLRLEVDVRPDLQRPELDPLSRRASSRRGSAG